MLLLFDRVLNKIIRLYRNKIFYLKTGYKANIVGNMTKCIYWGKCNYISKCNVFWRW